jgi:probable DNA metabolism protein
MSELPIEREILRFTRKILASDNMEQAALNRADDDVRAVLEAAYKTTREIDRMTGFLRFSPDHSAEPRRLPRESGFLGSSLPESVAANPPHIIYTARCAPDHFVLPALADHFRRRFGEEAWAIIDEKRSLALLGLPRQNGGREPRLIGLEEYESFFGPSAEAASETNESGNFWEDLWRTYHQSVNNEARRNPRLQRQLLPLRYRKYLTEFTGPEPSPSE